MPHPPPLTGEALLEQPPAPERCHSLERARVGAGAPCQACLAPAPPRQLPCQHKHGSLGRGSAGQAKPDAPSHRARMWGRRGLAPTISTLAADPAPGKERTWTKERVPGSVPRGMETPGAGASLRVSQESTSAPEPCGCGSQSSTSADPITDGAGSTALGPAGAPEPLAAVAAPGRWQGWRRAGCCRGGTPSPRRAGCGAGPCFLH